MTTQVVLSITVVKVVCGTSGLDEEIDVATISEADISVEVDTESDGDSLADVEDKVTDVLERLVA